MHSNMSLFGAHSLDRQVAYPSPVAVDTTSAILHKSDDDKQSVLTDVRACLGVNTSQYSHMQYQYTAQIRREEL